MLETTKGSLTIVNANLPNPNVFWKGERLPHVKGLMIVNGVDGAADKCVIRVTNPTKVQPALEPAALEKLNFIYNEMNNAGIKIIKL